MSECPPGPACPVLAGLTRACQQLPVQGEGNELREAKWPPRVHAPDSGGSRHR